MAYSGRNSSYSSRRSYGSKRGGRSFKKSYKKKWYDRTSVGDMARTAISGVNYLKSLVNVEGHKHDTNLSASVSSSGTVQCLTTIAQGDTYQTRTGNSILLSSLLHRCNYLVHGTATNTLVREIVFMDLQQVADTNVTVADVLETVDVLSALNGNTAGRFKVLGDTTIKLNQKSETNFIKQRFWNFHGQNYHCRYNGTASSDIQKGHIYVLLLSNEATNTPTCQVYNRISFYDN